MDLTSSIYPDSLAEPPATFPQDCTATCGASQHEATRTQATGGAGPSLESWEATRATGGSAAPGTGAVAVPAPYHLGRLIATGGMGEVWEATQVSLARPVAVKRMRPDRRARCRDEGELAVREHDFRQEALIGARLEHPNIVPLHDFGLDEAGGPLIAMKLVNGRPWDDVIRVDGPALPREEFLARHVAILAQVAQAVDFAHSRGVVHRDLKPGQVMVGEFGEVLLMDWGLALYMGEEPVVREGPVEVALQGPATASSPSGTPALMAPEQTRPKADKVGPWTDVYLLGGVLYKLLTGYYPHQAASARDAFRHAAAGLIEPPARRAPGIDHPAELEELCLACLQPMPEDRIASARKVVEALRGWLSGDTRRQQSRVVLAGAQSTFRTGVRDYGTLNEVLEGCGRALQLWPGNGEATALQEKALVAHVGAALEAGDLRLARLQAERLPAGEARQGLLGRVQLAEARARREARQRRVALRTAAALAVVVLLGGAWFTVSLSQANDRVRAQRDSGQELVNYMIDDLTARLTEANRLDLLRNVCERTLAYLDSLPVEDFDEQALADRAVALREVAHALMDQGDLARSQEAADSAMELAESLHEASPGDPDRRMLLGTVTFTRGRLARHQGDRAMAQAVFTRGAELGESVVEAMPARADALQLLSNTWVQLGELAQEMGHVEAALGHFEDAVALQESTAEEVGPNPMALARAHLSVGDARADVGDLPAGLESYSRAVSLLDAMVAADPMNSDALFALTVARNSMGDCLLFMGRFEEALEPFRQSLVAREALLREDPTNLMVLRGVGSTHLKICHAQHGLGQMDGALTSAREALRISEGLLEQEPASALYLDDVASAESFVLGLLLATGNAEEALEHALGAVEIGRRLVELDPENHQYLSALAAHLSNASAILGRLDREAEAAPLFRESFEIQLVLAEADPTNVELLARVAQSVQAQAADEAREGNASRAVQRYRDLAPRLEAALDAAPSDARLLGALALCVRSELLVLDLEGRHEEALATGERFLEVQQLLIDLSPSSVRLEADRLEGELAIARALASTGRQEEAVALLRAAAERALALIVPGTEGGDLAYYLARARLLLADLGQAAGEPGEQVLGHVLDALGHLEAIVEAYPESPGAWREIAHASATAARLHLADGELLEARARAGRAVEAAARVPASASDDYPGRAVLAGAHARLLLLQVAAAEAGGQPDRQALDLVTEELVPLLQEHVEEGRERDFALARHHLHRAQALAPAGPGAQLPDMRAIRGLLAPHLESPEALRAHPLEANMLLVALLACGDEAAAGLEASLSGQGILRAGVGAGEEGLD